MSARPCDCTGPCHQAGHIFDPVEERRKLIVELQARPEYEKFRTDFIEKQFILAAEEFIEAVGWHEASATWRKLAAKHEVSEKSTRSIRIHRMDPPTTETTTRSIRIRKVDPPEVQS
jgi:hypothetical protein